MNTYVCIFICKPNVGYFVVKESRSVRYVHFEERMFDAERWSNTSTYTPYRRKTFTLSAPPRRGKLNSSTVPCLRESQYIRSDLVVKRFFYVLEKYTYSAVLPYKTNALVL